MISPNYHSDNFVNSHIETKSFYHQIFRDYNVFGKILKNSITKAGQKKERKVLVH